MKERKKNERKESTKGTYLIKSVMMMVVVAGRGDGM
jgi:hypothetical protein